MAAESFEHVLPHLFRHEGGYADHPSDPGGATKCGVTRATLAAWRGRAVSKSEVRALTKAEAAAIYRARYWDAVKGDRLPAGIDYAVFDAAVNSGPARAAKWLQAAVRVPQDGIVGPVTLAAAASGDPARLIGDISEIRLAFLRALSTWPVFGKGWSRRVEEVGAEAQASIVVAEAQGSPRQRNWRPAFMIVCMGLLVWHAVAVPILAAILAVPLDEVVGLRAVPDGLWTLLVVGMGGYIGGRSLEKVFAGRG